MNLRIFKGENKMDDEQLKELRDKQLEILMEIDKICKKYNIKYSLFAGNALGAIRHKGFIPWDDDLDIVMNRNNYTKFKNICKIKLPEKYFYQDYHTDKNFDQCFAKIRDNDTAYIEKAIQNVDLHKGIFVDVFVFDIVPESKIKSLKQYIFSGINILLARGRVYSEGNLLYRFASRLILLSIPISLRYKVKSFSEKQVYKYNNYKNGYYSLLTMTLGELKKRYPLNITDEIIEVEFENLKLPIYKDYDILLTNLYGDYMKLPPKEERILKHNPIICDTKKSYLEYES